MYFVFAKTKINRGTLNAAKMSAIYHESWQYTYSPPALIRKRLSSFGGFFVLSGYNSRALAAGACAHLPTQLPHKMSRTPCSLLLPRCYRVSVWNEAPNSFPRRRKLRPNSDKIPALTPPDRLLESAVVWTEKRTKRQRQWWENDDEMASVTGRECPSRYCMPPPTRGIQQPLFSASSKHTINSMLRGIHTQS